MEKVKGENMASVQSISDLKAARKSSEWHKKIAASRGNPWRKSISNGRKEVERNPSLMRSLRLQLNMNQSKVAKTLGLTNSVYGAIERGKAGVTKDRAHVIAALLNTRVPKIFREDSNGKFFAIKRISSV